MYSLEFNINQKIKNQLYDRDNICIFAVLGYKISPKVCFIVANCHLLFNNNRGDIKLAQIHQTINALHMLKNHFSEKYPIQNLILCGDFNSLPRSAVYKYITEGELDCTHLDKRKVIYLY